MKKKIIIGFTITASLLYFGISCGKKEFGSILFDSINATSLVNPEYRLSAEFIKESDKKTYDFKLNTALNIITEINNNIQLKTLYASLYVLSNDDKMHFLNIQRQTLITENSNDLNVSTENSDNLSVSSDKSNNLFENLLIDIISPDKIDSIAEIQKAVRNDPTLTYAQLVKKLEHLSTNINTLKNITLNCINAINNSPMEANAKSVLLHGSSSNPNIKFLGFQTIYNKLITLKFE